MNIEITEIEKEHLLFLLTQYEPARWWCNKDKVHNRLCQYYKSVIDKLNTLSFK